MRPYLSAVLAAVALSSSVGAGVEGPGLDPMSPPPTITRFGRAARFGGRGMAADRRRAKKQRQKKTARQKSRGRK